jgi:hypothetical protein
MVKQFHWIPLVGVLAFAGVSVPAQGQKGGNDHFNGLHLTGSIHDFTTPMAGNWTIHGDWSLDMTGGPDAAVFTAELSMERSDLFFVQTPTADPNSLPTRNPHTHHISVIGTVTTIPGGFRVTSQADETTITGNGAPPTFEKTVPPTSTLQIDVTGGSLVAFSNVTLTFGGAAATHFGSNPIAGVVSITK